jgi:hypothetical protein
VGQGRGAGLLGSVGCQQTDPRTPAALRFRPHPQLYLTGHGVKGWKGVVYVGGWLW